MEKTKLTANKVKKLYKTGKMDFETAFQALNDDGISPALLNDDFGHWAVLFEGYQTLPLNPGTPSDIDSHFFIKKQYWKKTIKQALINALTRTII